MLAMPLVMHPSKVLWIDDDELFLQVISDKLNGAYDIDFKPSPAAALQYFQQHQSISASLPLLRGDREHEAYDLADHLPVDINLDSILQLKNNAARTEDVSVIIVDYHMPHKTGLELCYELRGLPIKKKILLTGEASHQLAVTAFNEGIIDCFMKKDDDSLPKQLITHIEKCQKQYFTSITQPLLSHLEADYKLPQSDPVFIEFFNDWCKQNQIIEYYLVDKNGTFLTINHQGSINYFVTHTERSLDAFAKLYSDDDEASEFAQSVRQRKAIPFFGVKKESWDYEFNQWADCFYSPQALEGREKYYWTAI